jgi:methane/ammonia monooxygenase subunit B
VVTLRLGLLGTPGLALAKLQRLKLKLATEGVAAKDGPASGAEYAPATWRNQNRKFVAADVAWEAERLTSLMRYPDSSFGGLLFFYDSDGERHIANVYGTIVPTFIR